MRSKSMLVEWTRQSRSCREKFSVGEEGVDMFFVVEVERDFPSICLVDGPVSPCEDLICLCDVVSKIQYDVRQQEENSNPIQRCFGIYGY